jgi:hypothetical protein
MEAGTSVDGHLRWRACSPEPHTDCHGWRRPGEAYPRLVAHLDAHQACRGRRSGSGPDTGIHWNSGAVPAPREKPPLVALAWQSTGRGNLREGADCTRLAEEPPALRTAAARVQARCETLYSYLANNMEPLVDYGRRYRNGLPISSSRARHDQSMTLPMPAWESAEGCGGRPKGLTE